MTAPNVPVHPKVPFGDTSVSTVKSKSHQVVRVPGHRKEKAHTPHPSMPADKQHRLAKKAP
jgi:hypothetical protein